MIKAVVKQTRGRVPVIASTGSNSTGEAIELTKLAEEAGADATLQVGPYYNKPTQNGFFNHFAAVAKSPSLPLLIYNIPGRTSRNIEPQTIIRLWSEIPTVVGLKDCSNDLHQTMTIYRGTDPETFKIYSGEDIMTLSLLCHGAAGAIAAVAHVVGRGGQGDVRGSVGRARRRGPCDLHYRTMDVVDALFVEPNPTPVKQALEWLGLPAGPLRPPLERLSPAGQEVLRSAMQSRRLAGLAASGVAPGARRQRGHGPKSHTSARLSARYTDAAASVRIQASSKRPIDGRSEHFGEECAGAVLYVLLVLFGLVIGSFLNVVIYRLPRHESLVRPGSHCPRCGTAIRWYDNVPVVSWLLLRGRCRDCGAQDLAPLSAGRGHHGHHRSALPLWRFGLDWPLLVAWAFIAAMVAVAFIDYDHMIIPNKIVLPGRCVGLVASIALRPAEVVGLLGGSSRGGGVLLPACDAVAGGMGPETSRWRCSWARFWARA